MDTSFIPQALKIDWITLEPLFQDLLNRPISSKADLETWMLDRSQLESLLEEDFAWRYIHMTRDTESPEKLKAFQYFTEEIEPKIAPVSNALNKKLMHSEFLGALDATRYGIYLRDVQKSLELFREENIPLQTKIQMTQQQYQALTGSMSVHLDGQEYTLEQAGAFLKDTDRAKRESTWRTISERRQQDAQVLDDLFDTLKGLRHQVAQNAGFENFRDYSFQAMGRFDYTPEDCFNFHNAIEKYICPILEEQAAKRAECLHLDTLRPWDMDVDPLNRAALKPFGTTREMIDKTAISLEKLDPYIGSRVRLMDKDGLFDLESRKGKAPGGYNYPLAKTGAPFIFMNSAFTFRDMTTLIHETGHATHTYLTADLPINDFKHVPSEVAELASMSLELLSMAHWDVFFRDPKELERAKSEQLLDVLKTLPWVATVDKFQHWLYTHPQHSPVERKQAWVDIYQPLSIQQVSWQGLESYRETLWHKQLHIFEVPFYYIEYGMAQLGAIAIWKHFTEQPDQALKQYLEALKLGYTKSIPEIYEAAGIKFDFSERYVRQLADFLRQELEKLH